MDNYQIASGAPAPVSAPAANQAPGVAPVYKDSSGLIKTIALIVVSLIAVTFIGLFIWMFLQYSEASTDVDGQIAVAVAKAKDEQAAQLEAEFTEREKLPYKTFSGPSDYGQLTFNYPKTWSVYVAADANNGGDYQAFFNPNQVNAVSKETINALRLTIRDKGFDEVASEYQRIMDRKDSNLTMQAVTIGEISANRYTGTIPDTDLNGIIVIFKIRDKTAVFQTDSILFEQDFNTLLQTITFNA